MSISKRISELRKELNLNQISLAKKAGLTAPSISQYESGTRNPSYEALVKLSAALNVSVDYLVSGEENDDEILNPEMKVMVKTIQFLEKNKQSDLLDFLKMLTGQRFKVDLNSTNPKKYADYLWNQILETSFPIDVNHLVTKLNITIIETPLGNKTEAMLIKRNSTILIDRSRGNESRQKLTITTLIGHWILPWHSKDVYYHRKNGASTTSSEDVQSQEAMMFAKALLTPSKILNEDFSNLPSGEIDINYLGNLAANKYQVSLTMFCLSLVEFDKKRFSLIISKDGIITQIHGSDMAIQKGDPLPENSLAFKIIKEKSTEKVLKSDTVSSEGWIVNPKEIKHIFESSIYNPEYETVMTFVSRQ